MRNANQTAYTSSVGTSQGLGVQSQVTASPRSQMVRPAVPQGIPVLTLFNTSLNINIQGINGAVIGRRQGPYIQFFSQHMYVSGVHAQLIYKPDSGWCIIDKHSSNGTKLNQRDLQPDIPMSIKSGDIVTLANINLQVSVS